MLSYGDWLHRGRIGFCLGAGLVALAAWADDTIPAEWGPLWQPHLPAREQHPSLFFDAADRPPMLERTKMPPTDYWWKSFSGSAYRCQPALRWWLLGDEAAARQARDDLLANPIWREETHGYLEPSSHRFADYILAYDVLAAWPGLTSQDQAAIRARIAAEADHYYGVMDGVPGGCNYGNQRTLAASVLGLAALTLCEYKDSHLGPQRWLTRALYQIRRDENWWFFRPGGHFVEGLGYTDYMGCLFVPFAVAYERASEKYLFADPRLREWLTFAAYQTTAQGEFIPWGTCESGRVVRFFALLSSQRYGRDLAPLCNWAFNWHMANPYGLLALAGLAVWEETVPGDMPPASREFDGSQTVVLRENWGHDTVSVWFAGKDPTWPVQPRYFTYSQGDAGHFVIAGWDEILAGDSGYDHWKSKDYFGAEFHNVLLVDGKGPEQNTTALMSGVVTEGPVRRATVTATYQGCTVRRTLALVRGRYVVVADRVAAEGEHDYAWQVRSTCPPDSPGSTVGERAVTWPGLDALEWRALRPGRTQLTTVVPEFARLSLAPGRWRPISGQEEFRNQVASARWRGASTAALFVLIPNLKERPDVTWQAGQNGAVQVEGPGWRDEIAITTGELVIRSADGRRP
jgi:hypothetical protein